MDPLASGGPPPEGLRAEKVRLREEMRRRLAQLGVNERRRLAQGARERFLTHPVVRSARSLLVCLSFGDELDTGPVVESWLASGRRLFVPRADSRDRQIHVHAYPCALETLSFGLRQPPRGAPELEPAEIDGTVDAVMVLGLAFDRGGFRLGHGSGYFDRFLAAHRLPAIGLAFDLQLVDRLPAEPHDVPMSAVVTESGIVNPPSG